MNLGPEQRSKAAELPGGGCARTCGAHDRAKQTTHGPQSSSFLGLPYKILNMIWSLWVASELSPKLSSSRHTKPYLACMSPCYFTPNPKGELSGGSAGGGLRVFSSAVQWWVQSALFFLKAIFVLRCTVHSPAFFHPSRPTHTGLLR